MNYFSRVTVNRFSAVKPLVLRYTRSELEARASRDRCVVDSLLTPPHNLLAAMDEALSRGISPAEGAESKRCAGLHPITRIGIPPLQVEEVLANRSILELDNARRPLLLTETLNRRLPRELT